MCDALITLLFDHMRVLLSEGSLLLAVTEDCKKCFDASASRRLVLANLNLQPPPLPLLPTVRRVTMNYPPPRLRFFRWLLHLDDRVREPNRLRASYTRAA